MQAFPGLVDFEGRHQAGIERPATSQAATVLAAFDVVSPDRDDLRTLLRDITTRARALAAARPPAPSDPRFPPAESGILGSSIGPADLTVTVSVGASLFDDRYGLAERRPRQLVAMPSFPNDQLAAGDTHGDIAIQVCAIDSAACVHALRFLTMGSRASMAMRWMVEGFQRPNTQPGVGRTTTRNLMGFKDGTSNIAAGTDELIERVWVAPGDDEPDWATNGSYLVARTIRMFVERWDRTALDEQEHILGRTKRTGAPLGGSREEDTPDYTAEPYRAAIPGDAHIRLANPHTAATDKNRILRRGYSFSRGFDAAGQLDQGLLFLAYQRDLAAGFVAIQERLNGEPLEEYIRPVGGGYFFTLPGVIGEESFLGESLLA
jgi:deferrochelatase/peroxidase EfeB